MRSQPQSKEPRNISGWRILQARIARQPEMSQVKLAECLEAYGLQLDQSVISRIENQDRSITDIELTAIARCLHVSVAWLCGEKDKTR